MRNNVFYKMIFRVCLFGMCVAVSNTVSAENAYYWDAPKNAAPSIDHSYNSETDNPWYQPEPQHHAPDPWSLPPEHRQPVENQRERYIGNQPSYYEPQYDSRVYVRPNAASPSQQAPVRRPWRQPPQADAPQDRYVTPAIIDQLNRQEAQHYARLQGEKSRQFVPRSHSPAYGGGYAQSYSAPPAYGVGSLNPAYDVPAVSPWGETPDVLHGGDQFPWMPNEAVGGVPPIHVPPYANTNTFGGMGNAGARPENQVFNPYTFLQNKD